jgi:hypothetical protein
METENKEAIEQIEQEIVKAKEDPNNFEIEVTDQPQEEDIQPKKAEEPKEDEYGQKVERRIKKLVEQRRQTELEAKELQEKNSQLEARLARLEQGSEQTAQQAFNQKYSDTKAALTKAVEEGDTKAQVDFSEQLADMRAAMRVAEMQKQQRSQEAVSPTVGRAQQTATPPPAKAMDWWQKNRWFNSNGYERETAAARAIDVQLDLEGHDKNSDEYYELLNNRLLNVFPELSSGESKSKAKVKSRIPVAPTAGGSPYKGNRVRLSQDQLRMARELGITDEKALKQYANEVQKSNRS